MPIRPRYRHRVLHHPVASNKRTARQRLLDSLPRNGAQQLSAVISRRGRRHCLLAAATATITATATTLA